MSINNMPIDILLVIAKWVGSGDEHEEIPGLMIPDARSLYRLALCSRRLNAISTPILYRNFSQVSHLPNCTGFGIFPFLKTILAKPELGRFVKSYTGAISFSINSMLNYERNSWNEDDAIRALHAIKRFGTSVGKDWWRTVLKGEWDALTTLTLSLLPNLHNLVLLFTDRRHNLLLEDMINRLTRGAPPSFLSQLRCITLKPTGTRTTTTLDLATAFPYFGIPSIQSLTFYRLRYKFGSIRSRSALPRRQCDFSQLRLLNCSIHGDTLVEILADFTSLTKIEYLHGINLRIDLLPHKFGEVIAHLKPCLKHLTIISGMPWEPILGKEAPRLLDSLAGFTQLCKLESTAYILVGPLPEYRGAGFISDEKPEPRLSDILPHSLSYLRLRECGSSILHNIRGMVERKRQSFPFLSRISLEYHDLSQTDEEFKIDPLPVYPNYDEKAADKLKEECNTVGITLEIELNPIWSDIFQQK